MELIILETCLHLNSQIGMHTCFTFYNDNQRPLLITREGSSSPVQIGISYFPSVRSSMTQKVKIKEEFVSENVKKEYMGFFFFKKFTIFYLFIYLFMTVLSLRFCARALPSCGKWGPLLIAVRGPLTIVASPVAEHRLQTRRLSNCGSRAQPLRGTWDPPRPGPEPVSPALAGRLPTTAPPGKPNIWVFN